MILLYESTETEFDSNGFGAIDHDIVNPEIFEQLNGQYQFTFKYPLFAKHGKEILPRRIVTAKDTDGKLQWFRITQLSKSNGYATVTAVHGTFDLTGNWIADTNVVQKDGDGAMRQIQSISLYPHQFMLRSDITTIANARMVRMTPTQAIIDSSKDNTFISRWGGQVYRDWNTITMLKRRGTDNGVTVRYRRDISSYTADVDYSTIYTVIHPVGPDGLELPEKYVESPNVEKYGRIVTELDCSNIKLIEPQTDSEEPTEPDPEAVDTNTAFQMMRDQAHDQFENGLDVPTSNFKIDIMNLANTKEYRDVRDLVNIHPWDTVTVIHEADDVEFKAQMISYKWIPEVGEQKGHYSQIELGTEVPTYTTETAKTVNKAIDTAETAKEKAKKVDGFEKIMAETSKAVEDVKEAVANAETDVKVATATANDAVISADLAVKNAGFAKDTAQSALTSATNAQKDVETVTTNANQALNLAKTALTNAGDAIKTATDAKTTVTNLSTTVDSINGTLATLATNEAVDTLAKTVADTSTLATQNAEAIKLKADGSKVDTLSGDITELSGQLELTNTALNAKITSNDVKNMLGGYATQTWTTGQITAKADSINLGVESVKQTVDSLQVGGRNLIHDTSFEQGLWESAYGNPSFEVTSEGNLKFSIVNTGQNGVGAPLEQVEMLKAYTLTAKVRGHGKFMPYIMYTGIPNMNLYIDLVSDNPMIDSATEFVEIKYTFTPMWRDATKQGAFAILTSGAVGNWLEIKKDSLKLESGNVPTDWTPAPEDMATTEWAKAQLAITDSKINSSVTTINGNLSTLRSDLTQTSDSLKSTISKVDENTTNYSSLEQKLNGFQTTVADKADKSQVTQLSDQLTSTVAGKADKSQITQLTNDINLRVQKDDVINQINISPESILIAGKKVHITGETNIDNAVIKSAMIESISADKLSFGTATGISLSAPYIEGGTIISSTVRGDLNISSNGGTYSTVISSAYGLSITGSGTPGSKMSGKGLTTGYGIFNSVNADDLALTGRLTIGATTIRYEPNGYKGSGLYVNSGHGDKYLG